MSATPRQVQTATQSDRADKANVLAQRRAGVLLHISSLPGPHANGIIGPDALRFVDFLSSAGFSVWQMLPVGPTDVTGSPYALRSAYAGGIHLLDAGDIECADDDSRFSAFMERERGWLLPYALFECLSRRHGDSPWWRWPQALRRCEADAIARALAGAETELKSIYRQQYSFAAQWQRLRDYANERGVYLFGDLPFYMDLNSADVWWHARLFRVDRDGAPEAQAGVPPDYFSNDGQLWGNPLYDWPTIQAEGFRWWLERIRFQLRRFDLLRIDHFRGLESHWEVAAGAATAREGHWVPTPGHELLARVSETCGALPLVAEDLGVITPAVRALKDEFALPGMIVLQFAFDGSPDNPYLPNNHRTEAIVYTGTHDNDTTLGWYAGLDERTRASIDACFEGQAVEMPATLIRAAYASPAKLAMIPMQDLLGLGSEARMNTPGRTEGNWSWRFEWSELSPDLPARFRGLAETYHRLA